MITLPTKHGLQVEILEACYSLVDAEAQMRVGGWITCDSPEAAEEAGRALASKIEADIVGPGISVLL